MEFLTREKYHEKKWKKVYSEKDCPFCKVEEQSWHTIWKGKYWYILHNISPYSGNEKHIMAVPYKHLKVAWDLTKEYFSELKDVNIFVKNFFWVQEYFSFTRETMANRSAEHYHIHFLVWKLQWRYLRKMLENQGFPIKEDLILSPNLILC